MLSRPFRAVDRSQGSRGDTVGRFYERHCFTMCFKKTVSDFFPRAASYLAAHKCVPAIALSRFFVAVLIDLSIVRDRCVVRMRDLLVKECNMCMHDSYCIQVIFHLLFVS